MKPKVQALGAAIARERRDGGAGETVHLHPAEDPQARRQQGGGAPGRPARAPGKVASQIDQPLLVALTRAFYWQQLLDDGVVGSGSEIAQREGLHHSTVNELLRLTLLEPAIIQSILAGQQPGA
jgi:hypothetical protein